MYRKPSGKLSFSFNRMITNAVVSMAYDSQRDIELTPTQHDTLFVYQLCQPDPRRLTDEAFFKAGIVDRASISKQLHAALCKASILSPHASDPNVYTNRIDRNLPHKLPFIDIHRQRKLVSMLFLWEEELTRWRLLDQEEAEIEMVLNELAARAAEEERQGAEGAAASAAKDQSESRDDYWSGDATEAGGPEDKKREKAAVIEQLNLALARVQAKKRMHPSMRDKEEGRDQRLPGYSERADTVAVPEGNTGRRASAASPTDGSMPARRGSNFSIDPVALAREMMMERRGTVA